MKTAIEQANLQSILSRVTGAVCKRNTIPILGNVKLYTENDMLTAVATDLDVEVTASVAAETPHFWEATVNATLLSGIVGKLPKGSQVILELQDQSLHVQAGRSKFKLNTLPVEDFPIMANSSFDTELAIPGLELKNAIDKTIWAASSEETRYHLNGVAMQHNDGKAVFVTTDGHRLSRMIYGENLPAFENIILPTKTAKMWVAALDDGEAKVELSRTKAKLTFGDVTIVSKTIEGTFPDWTRVVPKGLTNHITTSSVDMKQAVERVSVIATERTKSVRLNINNSQLELHVTDANGGDAKEYLDVEQVGSDVAMGVNGKYALDALAQADKGDVIINYGGPMDTLSVEYASEPDLLVVVMPLLVN